MITLTPQQRSWIADHVARGDYASLEEATSRLLDDAIALHDSAEDDLSWAKPLVDAALEGSRRGEVMSLDEHRARSRARLAAMSDE